MKGLVFFFLGFFFLVLFTSIFFLEVDAQCIPNQDWPEAPCIDGFPIPLELYQQEWEPYYHFKGQEWMNSKKNEMFQALENGTLKNWMDDKHENFNTLSYYHSLGVVPYPPEYYKIFFNESIGDSYFIFSPKKQLTNGLFPAQVLCKQGLNFIFKFDGSPACVKPESISKLIERSWATDNQFREIQMFKERESKCVDQTKSFSKINLNPSLPKELPDNFELKCIESVNGISTMFIAQKSPSYFTGQQREVLNNGGIVIHLTDLKTIKANDNHEINKTKSILSTYEKLDPDTSRLSSVNENLAWIRGMCNDCGKAGAYFPDGSSIEHEFAIPARMQFYDEETIVVLEGWVTSELIEEIANSLFN